MSKNKQRRITMTVNEIEEWGNVRNTYLPIAMVICCMRKTIKGKQRLWEEPSEKEVKLIAKKAFAICDQDILYWGEEKVCRLKGE